MKRSELEKHLGKKIKVFVGNYVLKGYLWKTQDERLKDYPNLYYKHKYYFLTETEEPDNVVEHYLFRSSHVRKVERM